MARTYRRRDCHFDYALALWDIDLADWNSRSDAVRQRLARFHSDSFFSCQESPPRALRKVIDRELCQGNRLALRLWLRQPDTEPLFRDACHCPDWQPM